MRTPTCSLCGDLAVAIQWDWATSGYECRILCRSHATVALDDLVLHPSRFFQGGTGVYFTTVDEGAPWAPYARARRDSGRG